MLLLLITPGAGAAGLPEWARTNLTAEQQTWIQSHPVIRARVGAARPDHFSINGEARGLSVDYLKLISERTGLSFDYITGMPWAGAIENVSQGRGADLLLTIKRTPEREALLVFTEDYLLRPWVIFTRKDAPFISHVNELRGKLVSVEQAYVMHELLAREFPGIRLKVVPTTLDALKALAAGQVDAYIGSLSTGSYLINTESLANIKVAAPTHFDNHNQAMAVRPDWAVLADIINQVLRNISPGEHQQINSRWFSVRFEHGIRWRDVLLWAGLGVALFSVIFFIIARKNNQLREEIAQRKQAVEIVRKSEQRFRSVFDQQFQFMAILAPDGRVLEVNELALRMQNYTREDYIGKLFWDSPAWQDLPEWPAIWRQRLQQAARGESPILTEDIYKTANGEIRFADAATTAIFDEKGGVEYFIVQASDTTERQKAREERARLNRELSQARKMEALGQLTGGIAHDFNNILGIVLGYTALGMEMARKLGEQRMIEYLARVERAGLRAKRLVTQMLAFSRGDESKPVPLQFTPLIEEQVKILRSSLPSSIKIETALQQRLPDVEMDPVHLQQIMMNLSLNARDAMDGSGTLSIGVKEAQIAGEECVACHQRIEGAWVELSVADTGPGITPDAEEHLFEPFFTTKPVGQGSGMGLAVVHGIMTRLDGHIIVESRAGEGCCIRLLFQPIPVSSPEDIEEQVRGNGEHLLVVDDEPELAGYLHELLELNGYQVTKKTDSRSALDKLTEDPDAIDLLITDQTMPDMSGMELIDCFRKLRAEIPVILCSGFSEKIDREQARKIGIRYLAKPIKSEQLLHMVREALAAGKEL